MSGLVTLSTGGIYGAVAGLYVRPSESGIGMMTNSWQYAIPGGVQSRSKPFDPGHKWQGYYTVGYDLPMSANSIEVNYLHLTNETHDFDSIADGPATFGSIFFPNIVFPVPAGFSSDARLRYKLNQVDLKLGRKYTDVTGRFSIKPSLGARYADLQHKLTFIQPGRVLSKFDGAGPLLSLDTGYSLIYGIGLVGHFDYGLLVGQINSSSLLGFSGTNFSFTSPKRDRIINSVDGKLGLDYNYMFSNASNLNLEVGYQVNEYLNAFDIIRGDIAPAQKIAGIESTSFGFQGPYISLIFHA